MHSKTPSDPLLGPILLVEDDPADAALIIHGFAKAGVRNPMQHVKTGDDALAYLHGYAPYQNRLQYPVPVLVLLDLKLPDVSGFSILHVIRNNRELRAIPVVILTGSDDFASVKAAYDAGASSYLVKTSNPSEVQRLAMLINEYWLNMNKTPALVLAQKSGD